MRQIPDFDNMMTGNGVVSTRISNSPVRSKEKANKMENVASSKPLAPIDMNQQRATSAKSSSSKGSTKHHNPSFTKKTEDPNASVTIEEVRKSPDGSVTIHRYLRGKLLGKVCEYWDVIVATTSVSCFCFYKPCSYFFSLRLLLKGWLCQSLPVYFA